MFEVDPSAPNVLPSRYRQVALSTAVDSLDSSRLHDHFVGKEAYLRTRFIVVRVAGETALVEVARPPSTALFSAIEEVRVLAGPDECCYVVDPDVDTGVPSQLAAVATRHPGVRCVVVEGRYSHVSFILNPAPLLLHVLDVVPPFPSKLLDQVQRVLDDAEDLPPIVAVGHLVDSRDVLTESTDEVPAQLLVPCRGSGVEVEGSTVSYLDERPPHADWTLLGCERSNQIHKWFYGSAPPLVDICPRHLFAAIDAPADALLTRCCLLQEGIEQRATAMFVPWGASLGEVREAIVQVAARSGLAWTPT